MKKTFAEQITDLENTRAAKVAVLESVTNKCMEEGRTKDNDERVAFTEASEEIESIDLELVDLRKMQAMSLTKAAPVAGDTTKAAQSARVGVQVKNTEKTQPGQEFARYAMCLIAAKGDEEKALRIAQREYPQNERIIKALELNSTYRGGLTEVMKAAVAAGTTTDATWVGPLVQYQDFAGDFVEFLRPQTIIGRFGNNGIPGLNRVPFNVRIAGQTTGGAGYWVGQGNAKPLTKFDFNTQTLGFTKVANIAVLTQESIRFSSPSAEMLVRNALAEAIIERIDIDFIDPSKAAVANVSPASILNGVTPISSTGTDAEAIRRDIRNLWAPFIAANNPPSQAVYIMTSTIALALSMMQNPLGQAEFPGLTMNGGTFMGVPVIVSEYLDNSAGSMGGLVVLVNARDIWLADDGQVNVDASDQVSLEMSNTPAHNSGTPTPAQLVSMWQTNSVAFRAERFINWGKRRTGAAQYLDAVNWGA